MLKYETEAYGKSVSWLDTEQAKKMSAGRKGVASTARKYRAWYKFVAKIARDAAKEHRIGKKNGYSPAAIDQIYLEAMIHDSMLPDKYSNLNYPLTRYKIGELYKRTGKRFFSYPPPDR